MKKLIRMTMMLAIILSVFFALTLTASAETYGNFTYSVSDNQVTITDFDSTVSGTVTIPSTIDGYTVTKIGNSAFKDCKGIKSVRLTSNITSIGNEAFENCSGLTSIAIPNSVTSIGQYAFNNCDSLLSVTLGSGLTTVPRFGFSNCDSLETIDLGSIITIDNSAFYNCTALNTITWSSSLKEILHNGGYNGRDYGKGAFEGCISLKTLAIPNSVTEIGAYSFYACTGLRSIKIGSAVTKIGNGAFKNCSGASTITLGNSVVSIGAEAFENCSRVTSISIPDSVIEMGGYVFFNCDALTSVTIGSGMGSIPHFAFACCDSLDAISLGGTTVISNSAFYNCISLNTITWGSSLKKILHDGGYNGRDYGKGAFENCTSLKTLTIPDSVTEIGSYSFYACTGLRSVKIGSAVTKIGAGAFKNCSSASTITLGSSVISIGSEAFENCTALTTLSIPDSVTEMGGYAFFNCDSLTSVTIGSEMGTIPHFAFACCDSLEAISLGGTTVISNSAFYNCISLNTITWGSSLKKILHDGGYNGRDYGKGAFENCTNLKTLTIPNSVTEIGAYSFNGCSGLKSIKIGSSVTDIGKAAFKNCSNASTIILGSSVISIGAEAFENCSALATLSIPDSVTEMGSYAFYNCDALTTVTIGDGLNTVPRFGFACCDSLNTVDIEAANTIDTGAFYNCPSLTKAILGISLRKTNYSSGYDGRGYGKGAFEACTALEEISLPNSVITLGRGTFYGCSNLKVVYFGDNLQSIDSDAFSGCTAIATVHYSSTSDDWSYVTINSGNDPITAATMKYNSPYLIIKKQPANAAAFGGKNATVTIQVAGNGPLTYTWYFAEAGSSTFKKTTSYTSNTYAVPMNAARNGRRIYCVISDQFGNSVKTKTVTLTLKTAAKITKQPVSVAVAAGQTAKVTVTAQGDGLTYKWYYANSGDSSFSYTKSFTGNTYSVSMNADRAGRRVYCVVTDKYGNSVKSNVVTLSMKTSLTITQQPKDVFVYPGQTAKVTVGVQGEGLTFKWYYAAKDSSSFTRTTAFGGNSYSVAMNNSRNGRRIYCVITDKYGNSVRTNTVTLTQMTPLKILSQPTAVTVANGKTAKATLNVQGEGLTFQWFFANATSGTFTHTTAFGSNSYSVVMNAARDGRKIFCVITDKYGNSILSNLITLNMA